MTDNTKIISYLKSNIIESLNWNDQLKLYGFKIHHENRKHIIMGLLHSYKDFISYLDLNVTELILLKNLRTCRIMYNTIQLLMKLFVTSHPNFLDYLNIKLKKMNKKHIEEILRKEPIESRIKFNFDKKIEELTIFEIVIEISHRWLIYRFLITYLNETL